MKHSTRRGRPLGGQPALRNDHDSDTVFSDHGSAAVPPAALVKFKKALRGIEDAHRMFGVLACRHAAVADRAWLCVVDTPKLRCHQCLAAPWQSHDPTAESVCDGCGRVVGASEGVWYTPLPWVEAEGLRVRSNGQPPRVTGVVTITLAGVAVCRGCLEACS